MLIFVPHSSNSAYCYGIYLQIIPYIPYIFQPISTIYIIILIIPTALCYCWRLPVKQRSAGQSIAVNAMNIDRLIPNTKTQKQTPCAPPGGTWGLPLCSIAETSVSWETHPMIIRPRLRRVHHRRLQKSHRQNHHRNRLQSLPDNPVSGSGIRHMR